MRPGWVATIAAAGVLLVAPATAGAAQLTPTTFGANLALRAPQSDVTCATLYFQPTCTISTAADQLGGTGETFVVPQGPDDHGTGTITAFHLAVGASTGPMQILLLQSLRVTAMSAVCCSVVNATPWFTPAPNSITTIAVNWPTENDNVPNPDSHMFAFDSMAISVSPGVALPVSAQTNAIDTFWAPACPGIAGTECDVYGGDERYVVTMSADWTPNPGTTNTNPNPPNPNPPHPGIPDLLPGTARGTLRGNAIGIPLRCATALCIGTAQLQNFRANNLAADAVGASAKHITYAVTSFRIAAGKRKTLKLRLTPAGRRKLHGRHGRIRLWLNATVRGGRGISELVTIKL